MFFKKSYIFETAATRYKRYSLNMLFLSILGFLLYTISCFVFILVSTNENKVAQEAFFQRPPDLIVVFTGDAGRIPYAIDKAKQFPQSQIFITGVYSKNSIQTLLTPLQSNNEQIDPHMLEIDHLARNTVENVIATLRYLRSEKNLKTVLIVSHDYHIMRIKGIVNKLKMTDDPYEFYYSGVPTDYLNLRNLRILYKEVFKLVRTQLFLMLWETDVSMRESL